MLPVGIAWLKSGGEEKRTRIGFEFNSRGREWFVDLQRVARLRSHPALGDAGWIRNNLVGRARVTVDWMFLRELIVERNARMQRVLPCVQARAFYSRAPHISTSRCTRA